MKRRNPDKETLGAQKSDVTREVTGADAARDDAETGSAGNGASPFGGDFIGVESPSPEFEDEYHLEPDPSDPHDIAPDKVERGFSDPADEDREYTAQPHDEIRPITADLLPTEDAGARRGR